MGVKKKVTHIERLSGSRFVNGQDVEIYYIYKNVDDYYVVGNKAFENIIICLVIMGFISIIMAVINYFSMK